MTIIIFIKDKIKTHTKAYKTEGRNEALQQYITGSNLSLSALLSAGRRPAPAAPLPPRGALRHGQRRHHRRYRGVLSGGGGGGGLRGGAAGVLATDPQVLGGQQRREPGPHGPQLQCPVQPALQPRAPGAGGHGHPAHR